MLLHIQTFPEEVIFVSCRSRRAGHRLGVLAVPVLGIPKDRTSMGTVRVFLVGGLAMSSSDLSLFPFPGFSALHKIDANL